MEATPYSSRRRRGSIEVVDAKEAVDLATAQTYSENVFLFVPNLIGKLLDSPEVTDQAEASNWSRLHANHFGWAFVALHELSSKVLHHCICNILSAGCCRRTSCASTGTDIKIWSRLGYGDWSVRTLKLIIIHMALIQQMQVYNVVFAMLSLLGVSGLCDTIPAAYCTWFQQSLHAHVQVWHTLTPRQNSVY